MKMLILLVWVLVAAVVVAQELPDPLVTSKGTFTKPVFVSFKERMVKFTHDAGLSVVPVGLLPEVVQKAFGVEVVTAVKFPALPDPYIVEKKTYTAASIVAVEPDGVRITHSGGMIKVPYQKLSPELQAHLGGFDATKAEAFRKTIEEQRINALKEMAAEKAEIAATVSTQAENERVIAESNKLPSDPAALSNDASATVTARSAGGKSTDVEWSTTWGSYIKNKTSTRNLAIKVSTFSRDPIRVKVEWGWTTKPEGGNARSVHRGGEQIIALMQGRDASVVGGMSVTGRDENYEALGVRERSGDRYEGWLVRVLDGKGRIIATAASLPHLAPYAAIKW